MNRKSRITFGLIGAALLLASMACQSLFPNVAAPGSTKEQVAKGDVRFEGRGNLSYGDCQDPTAVVILNIAGQTKEYEGQEFYDFVNPVSVSAVTDGAIPASGNCEKFNTDEKHNWPAKGLYYAKDEKILFFSCSLTDGKAEGEAYLSGVEPDLYFEGEYACYGEDGTLVYGMAFTVSQVGK